MGKNSVGRCTATDKAAAQARALPDFRPLRSAPASGVTGRGDHGSERSKNLPGQTSCGGARETSDQGIGGEVGLRTSGGGHQRTVLVPDHRTVKLAVQAGGIRPGILKRTPPVAQSVLNSNAGSDDGFGTCPSILMLPVPHESI